VSLLDANRERFDLKNVKFDVTAVFSISVTNTNGNGVVNTTVVYVSSEGNQTGVRIDTDRPTGAGLTLAILKVNGSQSTALAVI
jgi:hypothetical protein